ncbi:beta-scruin-like isoform X2 [Ornithodoros turicata]|uniref:beta-scruin-like isoform X2 n=1 Tax=Ornithodoros turicata TaxID=34597 RepID=UPI0031398675
MHRRSSENSYYTAQHSHRSRGDYYDSCSTSPAGDKGDVSPLVVLPKQRGQPELYQSQRRNPRRPPLPSYAVYRAEVETPVPPVVAEKHNGQGKNGAASSGIQTGRDGNNNGVVKKRNIVSESSYYGDTSVEAISAATENKKSLRRNSLPAAPEVLPSTSAPSTGARPKNGTKPSSRRSSDQGKFSEGGVFRLEGLMAADAELGAENGVEEKDKPKAFDSDESIQPSSQSTFVGLAPPSSVPARAEARPENDLVKALENLGKSETDEPVIKEKKAAEQQTSAGTVKVEKEPVVEEPILVASAAPVSKAIKYPKPKGAEKQEVKVEKCQMTGIRYPSGRKSYYSEDAAIKKEVKKGRERTGAESGSLVDVHEGFYLTENEIKRLLEENHKKESETKPKRTSHGGLVPTGSDGFSAPPRKPASHQIQHPDNFEDTVKKKHPILKHRTSGPTDVRRTSPTDMVQVKQERRRTSPAEVVKRSCRRERRYHRRHRTSSGSAEEERGRIKKNGVWESDGSDGSGDHEDDSSEDSTCWSYVSTRMSGGTNRDKRYAPADGEATMSFSVTDYGASSVMPPRLGSVLPSTVAASPDLARRKDNRVKARKRSVSTMSRVLEGLATASQIQDRSPVIAVFGGVNPERGSSRYSGSTIFRYRPEADTWEVCGHMPQPRSFHGLVSIANNVYVIGGYGTDVSSSGDSVATSACYRLDVGTMFWKEVCPMGMARACHSVVASKGCIYAIGGKDRHDRLSAAVEIYDVEKDQWEFASSLPRPLAASAATFFQGCIWILGGLARYSNGECRPTKAIYQYDVDERRWFRQFDLWTPLAYSLALSTDTDLWLWGGMGETPGGEVRRWSSRHRAWEPRFTLERHALCGTTIGNRMYVIGGVTSEGVITNILVNCTTSERTLHDGAQFPVPVVGAAAVTISGYYGTSKESTRNPQMEDSDEEPHLKLRTVYRRYRQRRKLRGIDDASRERFPKVGVAESTRVLTSAFSDTHVQRSAVSRETSPEYGLKEESLLLELRTPTRQSRKQKILDRDSRCSESPTGYVPLPARLDPNLGLTLLLEDEQQQRGRSNTDGRCSDTALAILSLRPCKTPPAHSSIISLGGIDLNRTQCHDIGRLVLYFHPLKNRWERLEPMPEPRNYHCAALVGEQVFVLGGHDPRHNNMDEMTPSDTTFCYSTTERTWTRRATMRQCRAFHACAVWKDQIYVIGGRDDTGRLLGSVDVYSPMLDAWSHLLDLPRCLMGAAAATYKGRLWILGGVTSARRSSRGKPDTVQDSVSVVDVAEKTCTELAPLPFPCAYAGVTVAADKLWLCGGLCPTDDVGNLKSISSVYVLDGGRWLFYDVLAVNRHALAAVSFGGSFVMCFGGVTTSYESSVDDCELFYDGPGHGNLKLRSPPFAVAGHAAVVVPGNRDVINDPVSTWGRISEAAQVP